MSKEFVGIPDEDLSIGFQHEVICTNCQKKFDMFHLTLLDAEKAPDYAPLISSEGLALTSCPHCATIRHYNGPLLWIRRSAKPHLFFLTESFSREHNSNNLEFLVSKLTNIVGVLPEAWTAENLQTIEYRFLPYLIDPFVDVETDNWVAPIQWQLLLATQLPGSNLPLLGDLVHRYPELLWAPANKTLGRMISAARIVGDDDVAARFESTRWSLSLLRLANGINIEPLGANDEGGERK